MAQKLECLLPRHEALSSYPQSTCKKLRIGTGEMAEQLTAAARSSVPSIPAMAHNHLEFQCQNIWHLLLISASTRTHGSQTDRQTGKIYTPNKPFKNAGRVNFSTEELVMGRSWAAGSGRDPDSPDFERQRQSDLSGSGASLAYGASFRPTRATQ